MTREQATEIQAMLREHNGLMTVPHVDTILNDGASYILKTDEDSHVVGCAKIRMVQWYQAEILHVSVIPSARRKGLARDLTLQGEAYAMRLGALVAQATTRSDNSASIRLLESLKYQCVTIFYNPKTSHYVRVWQKALKLMPDAE